MRWKCDQILEGVQQVFPIETPEPEGFGDGLTLRPYQRQSLAFMLQNERSNAAELLGGDGQRGGWLCDEVGMGKTAVCAALSGSRLSEPTDGAPPTTSSVLNASRMTLESPDDAG